MVLFAQLCRNNPNCQSLIILALCLSEPAVGVYLWKVSDVRFEICSSLG